MIARHPVAILASLAALLAFASSLVGDAGVGWPADAAIYWQLRVPRVLLAGLVGAALGASGAALQGALRNPLADSGLLGIGGLAALGAVIAYYWGFSRLFAPALPLGGLLGAAIGCAFLLAASGRAASGPGLILAGIAVSALASALLALALSLAPNPFALAEITHWLMGGVEDRTLLDVALALPPIALGCAILLGLGRGIDALSLGEDAANTLGVPVGRTLRRAALGTTLAVGAASAVAGGIGFVGLIVPHMLRPWLGERPSAVLAPGLFGGAALLIAADMLAKAAPLVFQLSAEPRLGVITALIGAPFLVAIARRAAP